MKTTDLCAICGQQRVSHALGLDEACGHFAENDTDAKRILIEENKLLKNMVNVATACQEWDDNPLPEDAIIDAAFPTRSGEHEVYGEAMRLVSARRSKFGLVSLVNWLLLEIKKLKASK